MPTQVIDPIGSSQAGATDAAMEEFLDDVGVVRRPQSKVEAWSLCCTAHQIGRLRWSGQRAARAVKHAAALAVEGGRGRVGRRFSPVGSCGVRRGRRARVAPLDVLRNMEMWRRKI